MGFTKIMIRQFSHNDFIYLVTQLKKKEYSFEKFEKAENILKTGRPFVLMRHDVDMDLDSALEMARIEHQYGITATYFFLMRTEHYNLFSKKGTQIILEILALGHDLGLHFDCANYPNVSDENFAAYCSQEAAMLEKWFSTKVKTISFHRPNEKVLKGSPLLSSPRQHTYMDLFVNKITYFSDSMGDWRYGVPIESKQFVSSQPLQILIHPIWWNKESLAAYKALQKLVDRKQYLLEYSLAKNCKVYRVDRFKNVK
jgi:hypothetical protein